MAKSTLPVESYVDGILSRDRSMLSRAITLIESTREEHRILARQVVGQCLPYTGKGLRVGVTGPPGAGKSTFIDALGSQLLASNKRIAVLAIDPSSSKSGGSILADKTRMTRLASYPDAFIRPSPTAGATGGLARNTREALILCEAAGYEILFVETVGAGQSEFDVHSMVDIVLLLLVTGAGDDIQGIKRGIMEMADLIVVNKCDGENKTPARQLTKSLEHLLHLMPLPRDSWKARVFSVSSQDETGIDAVWDAIRAFERTMRDESLFEENRKQQAVHWMHSYIDEKLRERFSQNPAIRSALPEKEAAVLAGDLDPIEAAETLLDVFLS